MKQLLIGLVLLVLSTQVQAQWDCSSYPCVNGGTCFDTPEGSWFCICPPGYGGAQCDIGFTCAENEFVSDHLCLACAPGTTNAAGDEWGGADTSCDITYCAENESVTNNTCVACPAGTGNEAGDDASGSDTFCDVLTCSIPPDYYAYHVNAIDVSSCSNVGDTCGVLECQEGYVGATEPTLGPELLCADEDLWEFNGEACERITCDVPVSVPANFEAGTCILGSTMDYGQNCLLSCADGFIPAGDLTLSCDGSPFGEPTGDCLLPIILQDGFESDD